MKRGLYVLAGVLLVIGSLTIGVVSSTKSKEALSKGSRSNSSTSKAGSGTVTTEGVHTISVTPWGPDQPTIDGAKERVVRDAMVQKYLRGTRNRMLSFDFIENDTKASGRSEPPTRFRATIFDYTNNRAVIAEGGFYDSTIEAAASNAQPNPSPDEFDAAVAILSTNSEFGPAITSKKLEPYPPMPPLAADLSIKGKPERTITVGLFPTDDKYRHEVVGVNMVRQTVVRYSQGAPSSSNAVELNCGVPSAGQPTSAPVAEAPFEVVISRDGIEFWRFNLIRPAGSSGQDHSGIELRNVRYQGKMVLARANTPILNVQYERNACGPFRDWLWQEGMFDAPGNDVATGIRVCTSEPGTIIDNGTDFGNFRGVAIWDREEVRLLSEMNAGWYRYISEWRFHDDGVIQPLFGYGATTNSCVCNIHVHHVYWRFDFDIATATNNNIYLNIGGNRELIGTEVMQLRELNKRTWVVENSVTGEAVVIEPGPNDGNTDKYGQGDLWFLRSHFPSEIDDGLGPGTQANLNPFVNGESLANQDVVVWYAGHWRHEHFDGPTPNHGGGPNVHGPVLRLQKY